MPFVKLAYVTPLVLVLGCGSTKPPFQGGPGTVNDLSYVPGEGGVTVDDLGDGGGHMAVIDMAGFNMPGSPMVVINSPTATTEVPNDVLTVTATITSPTNTALVASSLLLSITPPNGGIVSVPLTLSAMPNVYITSINISEIPSGMATFSVSATDVMNRKGSATGSYIHDHGPVITFLQPMAATAHGSVTVELMIDDALHPVTDPTKVTAYIHTAPSDIMLKQEAGAMPLRLSALVDFSKFSPPLDGPQIINATAVNSKGTTTHAAKQFLIDNSGPVIVFKAPLPGAFIGGIVEIQATIDDISGVNDASALAVFGNDPTHNSVPLTRMAPDSNIFHGFFDVRSLGRNFVLPELAVTAADTLGNSSQIGEEIVVDNTPAKISMDSKVQMYVATKTTAGTHECSHPFSPLGSFTGSPPEVAYDGAIMEQLIGLRARVEDHGNFAPGLAAERISGIDKSTVFLYAIPDDGKTALAVDTDGNGVCDNVNPILIPSSAGAMMPGHALSLQLAPLTSGAGAADFTGPFTPPVSLPPMGQCDQYGDPTVKAPPDPLCTRGGTLLTVVIPYIDPNHLAPIWSIPPIDPTGTGTNCVGFQLDSANVLPEGPTCVVTVATDVAGNTNVSAPLHICIDRHGGGSLNGSTDMAANPCAAWKTGSPPTTCTGVYDKTLMQIVNGKTCTPEPGYIDGDVRYLPLFQ